MEQLLTAGGQMWTVVANPLKTMSCCIAVCPHQWDGMTQRRVSYTLSRLACITRFVIMATQGGSSSSEIHYLASDQSICLRRSRSSIAAVACADWPSTPG